MGHCWCGFSGDGSGRMEKPIREKQNKMGIYWINTVALKVWVSMFNMRGSLHVT